MTVVLLAILLAAGMNAPGVATVAHATSATLYVDGSVSSSGNDCSQQATPCKTIKNALSQVTGSITTVSIAGANPNSTPPFNDIYCEQLTINASLILQAQDPINPPAIDGGAGTGNPCGSVSGDAPGHPVITVNSGTVTLQHLTIQHGNASSGGGSGGGVFVRGGTVNVTASTITNNTGCSTGNCNGSGGGIANVGSMNLTDSTVSGNVGCAISPCTGHGGGIDNHGGTLTVVGSTISGNIGCNGGSNACSGSGGGISNSCTGSPCSGGVTKVINSTISGNDACSGGSTSTTKCGGNGGGIYTSGTLTVINGTISANIGCGPSGSGCNGAAGGIASIGSSAAIGLTNTILAQNTGPSSAPDCSGPVSDGKPNGSTVVGNNLVGDGTGCTVTGLTNNDQVGPVNGSPIDPKLDPNGLQNNGGPTLTVALLLGSPAIGAADANTCGLATLTVPLAGGGTTKVPGPNGTDQRGVPYPTSAGAVSSCDIGAYQAIPTMYVATSGDDSKLPCEVATTPCQHVATAVTFIQPGGTVNLASGTYCEQVVVDRSMMVQAQVAANQPTIDGGAGSGGCTPAGSATAETPGHSVVTVGDANSTPMTVTLQNLTIQHGDASKNPGDAFNSPGMGGGIFDYPGATLDLTDSTLTGNTGCTSPCSGGTGGGIMNWGTISVTDSAVTGNSSCVDTGCATVGADTGGGIASWGTPSTVTVTDSTISGNTACSGSGSCRAGGIEDFDGTLTLTGSAISGNTACGSGSSSSNGCSAGGIYNNGGTMTLTNSTVSGNMACNGTCSSNSSSGGGIYAFVGPTTLVNSTVSGNRACSSCNLASGGGIYSLGNTTVVNSTVSGNVSCNDGFECTGGGIEAVETLSLTNSTVSGNNACLGNSCDSPAGGGIHSSGGTPTLSNSILAGNGGASDSPDCSGTIGDANPLGTGTIGDNLIEDGTGCNGVTNGTNGDQVGTASNPVDPGLGPLQDNGGPTQTMALLPGSRAGNHGDAATCQLPTLGSGAAGPNNLDQRGNARHADSRDICDVGAFDGGGPPGQPTNVSAASGNQEVTLSWQAPTTGGSGPYTFGVSYTCTANCPAAASTTTRTVPAPQSTTTTQTYSWTVTGLTNGATYTFTVNAVSADGAGPGFSVQNVVPNPTAPGPVTNLQTQLGSDSVTVTWNPPSQTNGSTITGYTVTLTNSQGTVFNPSGGNPIHVSDAAGDCTPSPCTAAFSGLAQGTYTLSVSVSYSGSASSASPTTRIVQFGPTAARVLRFAVHRQGDRLHFHWRLANAKGVLGFNLYAGRHRLNDRLIPVHRSRRYRAVERAQPGPLWLQVVLTDGRTLSLGR